MSYPRKIRNFNAFLDGFGYFGRVAEATMPELSLKTSAYRGGGMDGAVQVDMGQEDMTFKLVFSEWSPELLKMFGTRKRMVLRAGALGENDFEADSVVFTVGGRIVKQSAGDFKAGDDNMLTLEGSADYFRLEHNGETMIEIDIEAGKRVIGGEDQLASMRRAMGI